MGINDNNLLFSSSCHSGMFSIITFEEFISIALDADRTVGIYPEIKDPVFINKHVGPLFSRGNMYVIMIRAIL